ncbi:MAG: stalk domain-containing protein [Caldisericota bacterium]|nr:stalk domain-containing protein [Caldisericota bacterium]
MKKFLSIFIAVSMLMSFAAVFANAPTAMAATTEISINPVADHAKSVDAISNPEYYYNGTPGAVTPFVDDTYVYKMGDAIHGTVTFDTVNAGDAYVIELLAWNNTAYNELIDSVTAYQVDGTLTYPFQIGTGNVSYDGPYMIKVTESGGDTESATLADPIFIQYNLTWKADTIEPCAGFNTIEGWITRGSGQTVLVPVIVGITDPNDAIIAHYTVAALSSGYFALTFPVDPDTQVGDFKVFIRDAYPDGLYASISDPDITTAGALVPDNDWMIYDILSNIPDITMALSTYISPVRIYKSQNDQPVLLYLVNQDGDPVTGATIITTNVIENTGIIDWVANFDYGVGSLVLPTTGFSGLYYRCTVDGGTAAATEPTWPTTAGLTVVDGDITWTAMSIFAEISPGFYRAEIEVGNSVDVRFRAKKTWYLTETKYSNNVIINTVTKTVFNPYVDVTAPDAVSPYGDDTPPWVFDSVESVYDKLPCTIGNSFEIKVDSWDMPASMVTDWYVYDASWSINGPIEVIDTTGSTFCYQDLGDKLKVLITQAGKISVTVDMVAWERANTNCDDWDGDDLVSKDVMSTNACCHEFTKTFDICEVPSCTYGGVTLTGADVIDAATVEVGKKVDQLSISIDPTGAPVDLTCSCPNYIVAMYMTDENGDLLEDAFTVDTWSGVPVDGSMIWYNPLGALEPNIPDQPLQTFKSTGIYDENQVLVDDGLKFGDCPFNLYGITFNYPTTYTPCGYSLVVKVFGLGRSYDACDNMTITYPMIAEDLYPINVTPTSTALTATSTVLEGEVDPDEMLAGVLPIIDITDPGFSVDAGSPYWSSVSWKFYFNDTLIDSQAYCHTWVQYGLSVTPSTTDTGYRFAFNYPLDDEGTFKIVGTSYYYDCTAKEVVTIEIPVLMPEFTVQIGLSDGTIIDNDGIITEGLTEYIYVAATDPRGIHDFTTDTNWTLVRYAAKNGCRFPTSDVCFGVPSGCTQPSPIAVTGFGNPNTTEDPAFMIFFEVYDWTWLYVDTFTLVPGTAAVDPTEVPFTIPPTTTHVTLSVKDAHGHGVPNVSATALTSGVAGSGYSSIAPAVTNNDGEMDWAFNPLQSGKYSVGLTFAGGLCLELPCGWGIGEDWNLPYVPTSGNLEIISVYQEPVLDIEAPVVTADAGEVVEGTVKISGTVEDNVGVVSLYIGAMKVDFAPDGAFSAVCSLAEGENVIKVVAFDAAGNKGEVELTVEYSVPTVTVVKVQIGSDIMTVNGQIAQLDAVAEIKEGHTYLPLRAIAEALGAEVTWIAETKGITLVLNDNTVGLQIGNVSAVVNGNVVAIFPPYLKPYGDGEFAATMVPARLISEGLGAEVGWDPALRIVTITLVQP